MQKFLIQPLQSTDISTVIVIDALDECKDKDPESAILLILGNLVSEIPRVKFFITSQPEAHISSRFHGSLLKDSTHVFILHEVEPCIIDNDICCFFKLELSRITHKLLGFVCPGSYLTPTVRVNQTGVISAGDALYVLRRGKSWGCQGPCPRILPWGLF